MCICQLMERIIALGIKRYSVGLYIMEFTYAVLKYLTTCTVSKPWGRTLKWKTLGHPTAERN